MRLCNYNEYCPSGKGSPPRGGSRPGVAFAPVGDELNEWIAVGSKDPGKLCKTVTQIMDKKPDWGMAGGTEGYVQCCEPIWHMLKLKITYEQADAFCTKRRQRLCRLDEYCPNGVGKDPRGGPLLAENDVAWAPLFDRWNDWVFVANVPSKLCQTYRHLHGQHPEWGVKYGFVGTLQCCKQDGSVREEGKPKGPSSLRKPHSPSTKRRVKKPLSVIRKVPHPTPVRKIPRPKRLPKAAASPILKHVQQLSRVRKQSEELRKKPENENQQKQRRMEMYVKVYEREYQLRERRRNQTGETQFRDAYRLTMWRIRKTLNHALDQVKKLTSPHPQSLSHSLLEKRGSFFAYPDPSQSSSNSASSDPDTLQQLFVKASSEVPSASTHDHSGSSGTSLGSYSDLIMLKPNPHSTASSLPNPSSHSAQNEAVLSPEMIMVKPDPHAAPLVQPAGGHRQMKQQLSQDMIMLKPLPVRFAQKRDERRPSQSQNAATWSSAAKVTARLSRAMLEEGHCAWSVTCT